MISEVELHILIKISFALLKSKEREWGMIRYVFVSIFSGILFGIMDGFINANPLAQKLYEVYKAIARPSINIAAGFLIDLAYGFIMAGIFLLLYKSLPGGSGLLKGVSFALLAWFFRVVMYAASQWMTINLPASAVLYTLITGLGEMLIIGILYGLALKPMG